MFVALVSLALATVPPATASPDPLDPAIAVAAERGPLAAADHAMTAFARADLPPEARLQLALFAQSQLALVYRPTESSPPGDPAHLCRALSILAQAAPLAASDADRTTCDEWAAAHREALQRDHPTHRCDPPAGPRPAIAAPPPPRDEPPPLPPKAPPPNPTTSRRVVAWTSAGGVALGLGVASFVAMTAALVARERIRREAEPYLEFLDQPSFEPLQNAGFAALERSDRIVTRVVLATGVVGSVMALTGISAIVRGRILQKRMFLAPDAGPTRVALTLFARF